MATYNDIKFVRRLVDSSILRMPGVMGVATGYKKVKGKRTEELAVIVYVAKKLQLDRLPLFHAIPSALEMRGVKILTDVVEVGYYIPFTYDMSDRPALGGVSIGHTSITAGTLGGIVCGPACENGEPSYLILSNNHVLAAMNKGQKGDHIVQPGTYDGGSCHTDCIATLERFVPIDFSENAVNYVDCAVAKPINDSDLALEIHDVGFPNLAETYALTHQDVLDGTRVQKTGRTTQHTVGYVSAIDWKGTVLYDWTPVYFENQIVVDTLDDSPVGLGGDSGSLVLTMENKITGLLFAGPTSGEHYIANHIGEVFSRLDVRLCCAPSEAVRGTEREGYLPELRRFRSQLRIKKDLRQYFELYGKHSGKVMKAIIEEPELVEIIREGIEVAGIAIRNPQETISKDAINLGHRLIDSVARILREDKELVQDMEKIKSILEKIEGKSLSEALKMLQK